MKKSAKKPLRPVEHAAVLAERPRRVIGQRPDQIIRATPECRAVAETGKTLNQAFVDAVSRPIHGTWSDIASDLQGERISYSGALEACIDADRLWYGHEGRTSRDSYLRGIYADEAIHVAIDTHGYAKVLKFLAKHIKLGI